MNITILGYKLNVEMLIFIGILYLIIVVNTTYSCCNLNGSMEGFVNSARPRNQDGNNMPTTTNANPVTLSMTDMSQPQAPIQIQPPPQMQPPPPQQMQSPPPQKIQSHPPQQMQLTDMPQPQIDASQPSQIKSRSQCVKLCYTLLDPSKK